MGSPYAYGPMRLDCVRAHIRGGLRRFENLDPKLFCGESSSYRGRLGVGGP